jgi:hypothetical protein
MCDSADLKERLLERYIGREISVHLQRNGTDVVHTGILQRPEEDMGGIPGTWIIRTPRTATHNHAGQVVVIPETVVVFTIEDFWYPLIAVETVAEATEKIRQEQAAMNAHKEEGDDDQGSAIWTPGQGNRGGSTGGTLQ